MKKLIAAIIAVLSLANIGTLYTAEVVAVEYHEIGDFRTTIFETSNGNLFQVEDYTAPIGTQCLLIMDENGTDNSIDDEIKVLITFTDFTGGNNNG